MEEHMFVAKVISGHRVTIRNDIVDDLRLVDGDKVRVSIQRATRSMNESTVIREGYK